MRSEKDIFRLARLLVRSFREKLLPEEQAELDAWLAEDERHQELYRRYAGEAFLKEKTDQVKPIDWQVDYRKFMQKYPRPHKKLRMAGWIRYAAVLVLPLVLGLYLWLAFPAKTGEPVADILPVEKGKPVLTLAGGQQIVLTDSVRMLETDGTLVAGEAGTLSYRREVAADTATSGSVIYNRLEIPRGAEYFLILSDGTQIWLNSESVIRYPVSFTGPRREVYIEGEAFLKVQKDAAHPFIVHAAHSKIEVLGTEFNVRNYQDEKVVATTLVEGSVCLTTIAGNAAVLKPGEQGRIGRTDGQLTTQKVDTYLYTAWKDARFVFRSTRMEELLNTLSRWYDLQVFYQNNAVKNIRFTGDMPRMADFRQLLSIIEGNDLVRFTVNGRTITVSLK